MHLSIRQKVYAFAALAVGTALTMFAIGYWGHTLSARVVESMKSDYESLRAQVEVDMRHDALKADLYHALHAAAQQDATTVEALAQSYAQNSNEMREWLGKVRTHGSEARAAFEAVEPALDRYLAAGTAVLEPLRHGASPAPQKLGEFNTDYDALEEQLGKLSESIQAYASDEAGQAAATSLNFLMAGLAISIAIAIAFGMLLARSVCGRLDVFGERMSAIAHGTTDLTVALDEKGGDELAGIAGNFNLFVQKIARAVREVIDCSNHLARECEEIASVSARQRSDVDRQQHELTQVASAMEEMTASSQEVARHTASASEQVQESNRTVQSGTASLDVVAGRIRSLAENVEHSTSVITRVQQDCVSIGSVLEVIRGIADQTNLLALNAAIEAARAGEQGRGFAVVADEVRTLATRTQDSTREIQQTIERLQNGATEAVNAMNTSRSSASTGVQELQGTVTTLHTINGLVDSLTNMNLQIATAAEEQSSVAGEINRSVSAINALSNDAANSAARVDEAVRDLAALAEKLRDLTGTFRVA